MPPAYELKGDTIILHRELTELDRFLEDFLLVLKKFAQYLVVSGFVSISSGRTRGTEDIDVLVEVKDEQVFASFFQDILDHGFWCYQGDSVQEVWPYVRDLLSVRFARKNEMFPNIEFIRFDNSKKAKYFEFNHCMEVRVKDFEFRIPPIEFEILYKESVLKGKKDLEDARHLRTFFSAMLKTEKFKEYEPIIRSELL